MIRSCRLAARPVPNLHLLQLYDRAPCFYSFPLFSLPDGHTSIWPITAPLSRYTKERVCLYYGLLSTITGVARASSTDAEYIGRKTFSATSITLSPCGSRSHLLLAEPCSHQGFCQPSSVGWRVQFFHSSNQHRSASKAL